MQFATRGSAVIATFMASSFYGLPGRLSQSFLASSLYPLLKRASCLAQALVGQEEGHSDTASNWPQCAQRGNVQSIGLCESTQTDTLSRSLILGNGKICVAECQLCKARNHA